MHARSSSTLYRDVIRNWKWNSVEWIQVLEFFFFQKIKSNHLLSSLNPGPFARFPCEFLFQSIQRCSRLCSKHRWANFLWYFDKDGSLTICKYHNYCTFSPIEVRFFLLESVAMNYMPKFTHIKCQEIVFGIAINRIVQKCIAKSPDDRCFFTVWCKNDHFLVLIPLAQSFLHLK